MFYYYIRKRMESPSTTNILNNQGSPNYDTKDFVILLLIIVVILSVLGINIFYLIGYVFQFIFGYLLKPLLSMFGYASGNLINTTSDLASNTGHFGIDLADGTAHDIGNLLLAASDKRDIPTLPPAMKTYPQAILGAIGKTLDIHSTPVNNNLHASPVTEVSTPTIHTPSADTTESPIQNPISSGKSQWCLVGEYQQRTGCIEINDISKCMSGQLFPTQQACVQSGQTPTRISNADTQYGVLLPQITYK